ncbi:MAG: polymer-forming cytoskeletal protein [Nitrospira sp. CG24D]|jgi:cytoskeletal protein CcmA (bactofilin family)|nr:MAG: polymer-forming cytoskeletal protein [Nitrospira sp. CG24D]TKB81606.1 MAG: polymer-forming cytoskeletal protein [Nitrospira sp.]
MWGSKKKTETKTNTEHFTVLGKDVTFKGIVHFEGTVQLDSCFEGEIHTKGVLVVGEHAVIRGTVSVGTLISSGKIHGAITATAKVQLLKTAVQIGDVQAPVFSLEEGAYFRGQTNMGPRPSVDGASDVINALPDQALWENAGNVRAPDSDTEPRQLAYDQVQEALIHRSVPR